MVKSLGRVNYRPSLDMYSRLYDLGLVQVWTHPIYPDIPATRIRISPSKAGMSLSQVFDWVGYITGPGNEDEVRVSQLDLKLDLKGVTPNEVKRRLWCEGRYRKIKPHLNTLYLGSRRSNQWRIYDKALEMGVAGDLTRIEMSYKFRPNNRMTLHEFLPVISTLNPFVAAVLIHVDPYVMNINLARYNKAMVNDSIVDSLKQLKPGHRRTILGRLDSANYIQRLDKLYETSLQQWLQC